MPGHGWQDDIQTGETGDLNYYDDTTISLSDAEFSNTDGSNITCVYRRNMNTTESTTLDFNQNRGVTHRQSTTSATSSFSISRPKDPGNVHFSSSGDVGTEPIFSGSTASSRRLKRSTEVDDESKYTLKEKTMKKCLFWKNRCWPKCCQRKTDPELARLPPEERDAVQYERVKAKLAAWVDRSTFHGVDVLAETPPGWKRLLVFLLLALMCIMCWLCVINMVFGFLNRPINTVIVKNAEEFRFPAITVCPDSPFSMAELLSSGKFTR